MFNVLLRTEFIVLYRLSRLSLASYEDRFTFLSVQRLDVRQIHIHLTLTFKVIQSLVHTVIAYKACHTLLTIWFTK